AIAGTAGVFAMALVLAGMASGFSVEADRTLAGIGADSWVVPAGVAGPFTSFRTMPATMARRVAAEPGVREAVPFVRLRQTVSRNGTLVDVNVFGHVIGRIGEPVPSQGRPENARGQVVVDSKLGYGVGDRIVIGRWPFRVVGVVHGSTSTGGVPNVFLPIQDAQAMGFEGQPLATAIITKGVPARVPGGLTVMSNDTARADSLRPLQSGIQSIDSSRTFLWIIAAIIISAVVYLSALERIRD